MDEKKDVKKIVSRKRLSFVNFQEEELLRSLILVKLMIKFIFIVSVNRKTVSRGGSLNNFQEEELRSLILDKLL